MPPPDTASTQQNPLTIIKGHIARLQSLRQEIEEKDASLKALRQEEEALEGITIEAFLVEGIRRLDLGNGVTASVADGRLWARPKDKTPEGKKQVADLLTTLEGWDHLPKFDFNVQSLSSAVANALKNGEEVPAALSDLISIEKEPTIRISAK